MIKSSPVSSPPFPNTSSPNTLLFLSIKEFGAFVEFAPGKEGMVHISKISKERINMVEDVLTLGDVVKCKCMGKDKMGRISFSIKDAE